MSHLDLASIKTWEPYVRFQEHLNIDTGRIGTDRFVVAGDNRSKTVIAIVARERIVGRLVH